MAGDIGRDGVAGMNIAILIPTYFRPKGLRRLLQSIKDTSPLVHLVVVAEPDDRYAALVSRQFGVTFAISLPRRGSGHAWNLALAVAPNFDAYILGADDCYYLPGWYEAMIKCIEDKGGSGLFGLNDGTGVQHYLMTRDFIIEHNGGVMVMPHYGGWFQDMEACARARSVGKYYFAFDAKIVHDWHGSATSNYKVEGENLFNQRREAGFPDDYPPILEMEFPA